MWLSIGTGALGFAMMAVADWAGYRKIRILKPFLWLGMIPVFILALVLALNSSVNFRLSGVLVVLGWIILPVFVVLFLYSLYIEIPLRKTYIDSAQPVKVVTDGTYALCRHPAFLWFTVWLTAIIFISGSVTLAMAAPVWILSYIGCLFVEEKMCCLETFADEYKQYQMATPMLIPNAISIGRFWADTKSRFNHRKTAQLKAEEIE